jgi:hypothetical protein
LLCCILAQRLFEKKPTVFQNRSDYVYIFDKNGYRRHRASITVNFRGVAHQDTWALVDMSPRVETLSDFIQDSPFFTVIASSPRPSRWYQIMRYRGLLARWFMKPFSLAELIQASAFFCQHLVFCHLCDIPVVNFNCFATKRQTLRISSKCTDRQLGIVTLSATTNFSLVTIP